MPRPHGDCKFRNEWLKEDKFKSWVASDRTDNRIAKCSLCCKDIKIATSVPTTSLSVQSQRLTEILATSRRATPCASLRKRRLDS